MTPDLTTKTRPVTRPAHAFAVGEVIVPEATRESGVVLVAASWPLGTLIVVDHDRTRAYTIEGMTPCLS